MDDGQKTPRGHPDFNSYVKILRVFIFQTDERTDRRMDRRMERLIRCGLGNLIGSSRSIELETLEYVQWDLPKKMFAYKF
jgi:hypothetical protein